MKKNIKIMLGIILLTVVFCLTFGSLKFLSEDRDERYIDHIVNKDVDSSIGMSEIPENRIVDNTFTSHLPLIIIDTQGEEIVNYKKYNAETDSFEEPEGIDPYCMIRLTVIDNENHMNSLTDDASIESLGKIKIRGNSSASSHLPKHQYRIKLLDSEGNSNKENLLGLGSESTWIINSTIKDISYIRNYLAYNIAGQIEPFQSDVRFCEVLFKNGNSYEYVGLYMLYEPVLVSENRINISKNESKYDVGLGYLLRKDRYDKTAVTINTWASENGYYEKVGEKNSRGESYFTLEYPKNENVNQAVIDSVKNDLTIIEKLLYSNDENQLMKIDQYLDLESFADYFIINEFFGNYDAGMYSTYMYKSPNGKLNMGPYWDFDAGMDNAGTMLADVDKFALTSYPWFNQLLKRKDFVDLIKKRYYELRGTILNESYLNSFIDDAQKYLGNAVLRDRSAYDNYVNKLSVLEKEDLGLTIDRRRDNVADEIQRIKDYLHEHGDYMDKHIDDLYEYVEYNGSNNEYNSLLAFGFIITILICSIIAQRYRYLK